MPLGKPRRRSRRSRRRVIALVTVAVMVGGIATCGTILTNTVRGFWSSVTGGTGDVTNPLDGILGAATGNGSADGELVRVGQQITLGAGATAVGVAGDLAVYAEVKGKTTEVVGLVATSGTVAWQTKVELGATDLHLTTVGDVLLLDGESSTTDEGNDARVALNAADGKQLWKKVWEWRRDVVFVGTTVVFEDTVPGTAPKRLVRLDLKTGKESWDIGFGGDTFGSDSHRAEPIRQWTPESGPAKGAGTLVGTEWRLFDALTASPSQIVQLRDEDQAAVIDLKNGAVKGKGKVPIENEHWTVFDGQIIGLLNDDASPGAPVLAGYALDGFKQKWKLDLQPGDTLEHIKPCGEHRVCASLDGGQYRTIAIDAASGKETWSQTVEFSDEENWFVTPKGMLFGAQFFDTMQEPVVLDFDNKVVADLKDVDIIAARDGRALGSHTRLEVSTIVYQVAVWDMTTGKRTGSVDVGAMPEHAAFAGSTGIVISRDDRKVTLVSVKSLG